MRSAVLRELYGGLFATVLPDGQEVVWRPLTVGEFIEYDRLIKLGQYPLAYLEDEIFKKCVQNKFLVDKINELPAGIVSTVAATILQYSGPHGLDELNYLLNLNRGYAEEVLNQIVGYICWAFPAYKPEDVYAMSYETLMLRTAQAEGKLARLGLISEPLVFYRPDEVQVPQQAPQKKPTEDLLTKYYEQEGYVDSRTGKTPTVTKRPEPKPRTPVAPPTPQKTVIRADDIKEHTLAYVGHEAEDKFLLEHSMVNETAGIYKDYLDQLQKDGKIKFKSDEERLAEAQERMRKNAAIIAKIDAKRSQEDKELQEVIKQKQAAKKERKKKVPGRRR